MGLDEIRAKEARLIQVLERKYESLKVKKAALDRLVEDLFRILASQQITQPFREEIFQTIGRAASTALDFRIKIDPCYEQLIPKESDYFAKLGTIEPWELLPYDQKSKNHLMRKKRRGIPRPYPANLKTKLQRLVSYLDESNNQAKNKKRRYITRESIGVTIEILVRKFRALNGKKPGLSNLIPYAVGDLYNLAEELGYDVGRRHMDFIPMNSRYYNKKHPRRLKEVLKLMS